MKTKIAINGYGRIGRLILRAVYENNRRNQVEIVAINDLSSIETSSHLTRYDTVHGKFFGDVKIEGEFLVINGDRIKKYRTKIPEELPWKQLDIDVVMDCTGAFRSRERAITHVKSGAKKVLISAPGKGIVDNTIVYGINHNTLRKSDLIVSNASCTTNCLVPLIKPLLDTIGLKKGFIVTTHSYTNDQVLIDRDHKDLRRARAAALSIIPTNTGAAKAVSLILPELKDCLDGYAIRVPTANVSIVDLTFLANRETSVKEVNSILKKAAEDKLKGILSYNDELLVSHDFNHNPSSAIFDATLTKIIGNFVKVSAWYDNEWGFSNRMIDTAISMMNDNDKKYT